jgi:hypothetical protein
LPSSRRSKFVLLWLISALLLWASGPGFRSNEHYHKHGAEFGAISQQEYLRLAQALRDAPAGGTILQFVRHDGVITKFDKSKGYFGAL